METRNCPAEFTPSITQLETYRRTGIAPNKVDVMKSALVKVYNPSTGATVGYGYAERVDVSKSANDVFNDSPLFPVCEADVREISKGRSLSLEDYLIEDSCPELMGVFPNWLQSPNVIQKSAATDLDEWDEDSDDEVLEGVFPRFLQSS